MKKADYKKFRFSITCHSDDGVIVHCLRAIGQYSETEWPRQIVWGGTTLKVWKASNNQMTLHFTSPSNRGAFRKEALRILPKGSWREVSRNDNDPAKRQRP